MFLWNFRQVILDKDAFIVYLASVKIDRIRGIRNNTVSKTTRNDSVCCADNLEALMSERARGLRRASALSLIHPLLLVVNKLRSIRHSPPPQYHQHQPPTSFSLSQMTVFAREAARTDFFAVVKLYWNFPPFPCCLTQLGTQLGATGRVWLRSLLFSYRFEVRKLEYSLKPNKSALDALDRVAAAGAAEGTLRVEDSHGHLLIGIERQRYNRVERFFFILSFAFYACTRPTLERSITRQFKR